MLMHLFMPLLQIKLITVILYSIYSMPDNVINCLQKLQNIAARILTKNSKQCHITPILKLLYWLPVKFCVFQNSNANFPGIS